MIDAIRGAVGCSIVLPNEALEICAFVGNVKNILFSSKWSSPLASPLSCLPKTRSLKGPQLLLVNLYLF